MHCPELKHSNQIDTTCPTGRSGWIRGWGHLFLLCSQSPSTRTAGLFTWVLVRKLVKCPPVGGINNLRGACWSTNQLVHSNSANQGLLHGVGSKVSYEIYIELIAPPITHQIKKKNHETMRTYQFKVKILSVTCTNQAELSQSNSKKLTRHFINTTIVVIDYTTIFV